MMHFRIRSLPPPGVRDLETFVCFCQCILLEVYTHTCESRRAENPCVHSYTFEFMNIPRHMDTYTRIHTDTRADNQRVFSLHTPVSFTFYQKSPVHNQTSFPTSSQRYHTKPALYPTKTALYSLKRILGCILPKEPYRKKLSQPQPTKVLKTALYPTKTALYSVKER